jgi:SAM-dependent methyltransferase
MTTSTRTDDERAASGSRLQPTPEQLGDAWRAKVQAEREQVERLREFRDDDHYAPIASFFKDDPRRQGDDVLDALLAISRPDVSWLDIGAGGGRYALPLALHSRHVTAVEPSEGMRAVLREGLAEHGIANVDIAPVRWPAEAGDLRADFSLAAHVGYDLLEINPFIDAMQAATRERCVWLLLDRAPSSGFTDLWQAVHGEPRAQLPALRELLHLLLARGVLPDVRVFPRTMPNVSPDDFRASARRRLWLTEGSPKDQRLQALLDDAVRAGEQAADVSSGIGLISWAPLRPAGAPRA